MVSLDAVVTASRSAEGADRRFWALVVALAALVPALVTVIVGGPSWVSDAHGALLVTEQILTSATIRVDAYGPEVYGVGYHFYEHAGHYYYFFPLGSSIAAIPLVAVALAAGVDILDEERTLQVIAAAIIAAACVVLMYRLARYFLGRVLSLALALLFWFATPLASTGATAMWSQNFAALFGLMALVATVAATRDHRSWTWALLGGSLFMAILSRPSMAILAAGALLYTLVFATRVALRACVALAALTLPVIAISRHFFDQLLPAYYLPQRLGSEESVAGLLGILVSPSRGLVVFVPMLLLIPLMALIPPRIQRSRLPLLALAVMWPVLTVLAVGRFGHWWGGWSYGPRLLTEVIPGIFLATVLVWPTAVRTGAARVIVSVWIVLAGFGVYVHTVQGLFNPWTAEWNRAPNVDVRPETLWDWRYPQFLHDEQRHADRLADYGE